MNDLSHAVEQLTRNVADLQQRVSALEHATEAHAQPPVIGRVASPAPAAPTAEAVALAQGGGVFSVLGKAMLGIAGAYLLRALAASTVLPRTPVVVVAILYAFLWLIPATRTQAKAWFASPAWAFTSALILVPMLWELTLRFRALPDGVTAGILGAYVIVAAAVAWRRHFAAVAWVTDSTASIAAVVLAIATRDMVPFIVALLAMAIVGEVAAARHRTLRVRPLVALAADFALFALIWIYSSPAASRENYAGVGAAWLLALGPALLLVYAASATVQTMLLRHGISFFETAQTLVAFLLAVWGLLAFWSESGAVILGVLCLGASAAGYAVTFGWFSRTQAQRNYHVYATGSLALLLAGSFLCLPAEWAALWFGVAAVAVAAIGTRTARFTLQFHGLALLAGSAVASGLFVCVAHAMAGATPASPGWIVPAVCAAAILCYAGVGRTGWEPGRKTWWYRLPRVLFAALAVGGTASLLVWALVRMTAMGIAPGAEHVAVIRTLVACGTALGLAWGGSVWERRELVWLAWAAVGFIACKLLFEDLRHGHLGFTAASIFLYAVTLLLVPRLLHSRHRVAH